MKICVYQIFNDYMPTCNSTVYSLITFRALTRGEYPKILNMQNIPNIRYVYNYYIMIVLLVYYIVKLLT